LCLTFIQDRIETAKMALHHAHEARNDDTKSSAGDKYETGREMMQQEIVRNTQLLADATAQLNLLQTINPAEIRETAGAGSLVYSDQGNFYISISAGQLHYEHQSFYAVSAVSPIGRLLAGKRKGDHFTFNGKSYILEQVY